MAGVDLGDAAEDRLYQPAVAFQQRLAFRRDRVKLTRPVGRVDANQPLLFEKRQGRINDARARCVSASHAILDRLDDFIAMRGLFADQFQDDEADIALVEHPAAGTEETERPVHPAATTGGTFVLRATMRITVKT